MLQGPKFTMSPDQKGIETRHVHSNESLAMFTMSPDQKGIETEHFRDMHRLLRSQ